MNFDVGEAVYLLLPIFTRNGEVIPEGSFGILTKQWADGIWLVEFPEMGETVAVEEAAMEIDFDYYGS